MIEALRRLLAGETKIVITLNSATGHTTRIEVQVRTV